MSEGVTHKLTDVVRPWSEITDAVAAADINLTRSFDSHGIASFGLTVSGVDPELVSSAAPQHLIEMIRLGGQQAIRAMYEADLAASQQAALPEEINNGQ